MRRPKRTQQQKQKQTQMTQQKQHNREYIRYKTKPTIQKQKTQKQHKQNKARQTHNIITTYQNKHNEANPESKNNTPQNTNCEIQKYKIQNKYKGTHKTS